jgi:hypothetical protein
MLRNRVGQILAGALVGYSAFSVVIASDEQQRELENANVRRDAVDSGARQTVSDAEPRESVSAAEPRKSVSDAEPRNSVSDAKVQHTETEAKASSKVPDGKMRGEEVKSDYEDETSGTRDEKQNDVEVKEPRD